MDRPLVPIIRVNSLRYIDEKKASSLLSKFMDKAGLPVDYSTEISSTPRGRPAIPEDVADKLRILRSSLRAKSSSQDTAIAIASTVDTPKRKRAGSADLVGKSADKVTSNSNSNYNSISSSSNLNSAKEAGTSISTDSARDEQDNSEKKKRKTKKEKSE